MKQFLITVAGVLVGLILFLVVTPIVLISMASNAARSAAPVNPAAMVLTLDLREGMADQHNPNAFTFGEELSTVGLIQRLDAASRDDKVKGLYVRANTLGLAPAQAEEIRTAIAAFRATGKFVITHLQSDALESSLGGYAATAGSDELWLQDTGGLMPMGIASETTFLAGMFAKYGVAVEAEQREEYKNAVNVFTQRAFTPAHREATTGLLGSVYDRFVETIAADRKLTPEAARAAIEATPYLAADAVKAKLADQIGRPEDAEQAALDRAGANAELVDIEDYQVARPKASDPVIALVGGEGAIVTGLAEPSPFADESAMFSDDIAAALIEAAEDENVKAIVFRVSSPGGSPVASDQILNAVNIARKSKPVVVSMGEYAASGGYYVSASADAIVALPTTITGSIGIYGVKLAFDEALDRYLAVNTEEVKVGSPLTNMFTPTRKLTNAEREAFARIIDQGYTDFKGKVAEGRKLRPEKVAEIAKGRVWTGAQAKGLGLVDELGGLQTAVNRAKALAKINADQAVTLKTFPAQKSPFEQIQELFGVSGEAAAGAAALAAILGDDRIEALLREARAADRPQLRAEEPVTVR